MNEKRNYVEEILTLMRGKNSPKVLKDAINEYHGSDLADAMTRLDVKERQRFYRVLSNEHLAEVLEYTENADEYLEEMSLARAAQVIEKMESDEAVDLLKESDSPKKEAWLELMDPETRKNLQHLAAFDEDMVASRMTTNYVVLESEMTVKEAMKSLIEQAKECDNVSVLYVLDSEGIYYGAIDLKGIGP